jgi:hypothetical protein
MPCNVQAKMFLDSQICTQEFSRFLLLWTRWSSRLPLLGADPHAAPSHDLARRRGE